MSDEPPAKKMRGILSEETVHREGQPDVENPYWLGEEAEPHPNPLLGCIRRGLCCKSNPGRFGPGEVEKAAALLDLKPDEFVRRFVVIDAVEVDGRRVEVFVPVKLGVDGLPLARPGTRVDRLYTMFRSPCVFYDGQGCRIYGARPVECRKYICTNEPSENLSMETLGRMWLSGAVSQETSPDR